MRVAGAHARRKFIDAVKVNPNDGAAAAMVVRMDALFLVDREARQRELNVGERLALRREHAECWAEEIRRECLALSRTVLPKSALSQAVNYTLESVGKAAALLRLRRSGVVQQPGREFDASRKNWLHVGSPQSGPKVAAIISVIESCRRLGVAAKEYLLDVLPGMNQRKLSEVAELTPAPLVGST